MKNEEKHEGQLLIFEGYFSDRISSKTRVYDMVKSRDQNAERSHNKRIDNSSIERVEEFKYLGKH
jgi:hypothetical protein